jgi:hypothetical protein
VSCYLQFFRDNDQIYSYDLVELGRFAAAHERLMAHWRAALPDQMLTEVWYEDLVADLEGTARRLIAHCDLPWAESCLSFHTNPRVVMTASAAQVRRPVYADSIGRGSAYQPYLHPLVAALGQPPLA